LKTNGSYSTYGYYDFVLESTNGAQEKDAYRVETQDIVEGGV
jgi:hypothetical protein